MVIYLGIPVAVAERHPAELVAQVVEEVPWVDKAVKAELVARVMPLEPEAQVVGEAPWLAVQAARLENLYDEVGGRCRDWQQ